MDNEKGYDFGKRPGIVLSVHYCAKCGGRLTSRSYEDSPGVSYEVCECPSCSLTWHVSQYPSGEVRVAEVSPDEEEPDGLIDLGG